MTAFPARRARSAASMLLALGLGGCAITISPKITLAYPPAHSGPDVASAPAEAPSITRHPTVVLLLFVDLREDLQTVGTVRNDYGLEAAPIRATNSVGAWIHDALRLELMNAGHAVVDQTASPDSALILSGDILNVHTDDFLMSGADVSLDVRLRQGGRELLGRSYAGHGSVNLISNTPKSYQQSLARALADLLRQLVPDVGRAIAPASSMAPS